LGVSAAPLVPSHAIGTTDGGLQIPDFDQDQSMGSCSYGTLPAALGAVLYIHTGCPLRQKSVWWP